MTMFETKLQQAFALLSESSGLLSVASMIGPPAVKLIQHMMETNPQRVSAWEKELTTPAIMKDKFKNWLERGLLTRADFEQALNQSGDNQPNGGQSNDVESRSRFRAKMAKNNPSKWLQTLSSEQHRDVRRCQISAKSGNAIQPPKWITTDEERLLFNNALGL